MLPFLSLPLYKHDDKGKELHASIGGIILCHFPVPGLDNFVSEAFGRECGC